MTPLRVVQWTTGNVGERSVLAVTERPDLELVGVYAWSPEKVGRDVGGVIATNDVDALLALKPDCVVYNPMWSNTDDLVRILEAGVNVVSTAAFITGGKSLPDRDRIAAACQAGGASMFGTGISPGFIEFLAIASAGVCDRIDKVTVFEAADTTMYDSPATEIKAGFAQPIDSPDLQQMAAEGTAVFGEAVALLGDALGVTFDDIVCEAQFSQTTEDVVMESWTIKAGHVAGMIVRWLGKVGDRDVVELNMKWRKGWTLEPDLPIDELGHKIVIEGQPTITTRVEFMPPPDFQASSFADFMKLGHIMTAVPAINAIPSVVAAPPGIVTYNDIVIPTPRGWIPRA
jgi:4-hydroxy-tetrahydrodipicolinate reductase